MSAISTDRIRLPRPRTRRTSSPYLPLLFVLIVVACAVFAPLIAPHDAMLGEISNRLKPPAWATGGSWDNLLGTDGQGRDILSRLVFGARVSLTVGLVGIGITAVIGCLIGMVAGYLGGWVDAVLMRLVDMSMSIPGILLAILLAVAFGPSFGNVIIVVSFMLWAGFARIVRGEVLAIRSNDYIQYAKVVGSSRAVLLMRHILPNVLPSIIVLATLELGHVILLEASMSFLGVGLPQPTPSWGSMIADGRGLIELAWWVSIIPGIVILLTVVSVNLMGDWIRDQVDPKLRDR
jgi:peptide/nickel transport system permease protein